MIVLNAMVEFFIVVAFGVLKMFGVPNFFRKIFVCEYLVIVFSTDINPDQGVSVATVS